MLVSVCLVGDVLSGTQLPTHVFVHCLYKISISAEISSCPFFEHVTAAAVKERWNSHGCQ